jgi:hypothetical protein
MSLPNPINVTYVSPSVEDTFPFQYIVKDTDNIINIDTTNGAVDVILRNIQNSGILQYQPLLSINDGGNNASINNITIYPSEGDVINDSTSFVLNTDGANSVIQISNINQWVTTSSQSSGGGGTLLDGLNYTYVYGNGATALENGQQLLDGYEDAKTKVVTYNPTIDYGALEIVSQDGDWYISEPLNTALLEPYFSNGELQLYSYFNLELDNVLYSVEFTQVGEDYVFRVLSPLESIIGSYSSAIIQDFYLYVYKSVLIVGAGFYELDAFFHINTPYVDIVSLTGNCDVFITNINDTIAVEIDDNNIYVRGLNTGTQQILIDISTSTITFENCIGGDGSFSSTSVLEGKFINCQGGDNSFNGAYLEDVSGTFIDCVGGIGSFGGNGTASGTFINCTGGYDCFGYAEASGVFENCKGQQDCFGSDISSGTFRNCVNTYNGFSANGEASGNFYNCSSQYSSFAGSENGIASGNFYNCTGTYNCYGGANASGNFYNCVGGSDCFGSDGDASGNFYNCTASNNSFGSQNVNGYFYNCTGTNNCFGIAYDCNISGLFENCYGTSGCFGSYNTDGVVSGTFTRCNADSDSFGYLCNNVSGTFTDCKGGYNSFGAFGIASGNFYNCVGGGYAFGGGDTGLASGNFYNCNGGLNCFGGNGGTASGNFNNCTSSNGGFGGYGGVASGLFNACIGNSSACFGGGGGEASGTFINCMCSLSQLCFGGGGGNASGVFINCTGYTSNTFGGGGGTLTGTLSFCKLTDGTFPTVSGGGKTRYCLDGNNATNNQG